MKRSGEVGPNKMDNLSSLPGYGTLSGIAGMEGVVIKVKGNKVTLLMESLQAQLSMKVPHHKLTRFKQV